MPKKVTQIHFTLAKYRISVDPDICAGCMTCVVVCSLYHEGEVNPELARIRVAREVLSGVHLPETCIQCPSPWCMPPFSSCPAGAMRIDENTGAKVIDEEKCVCCMSCVKACVFGLIGFNKQTLKAFKCDFCGGDPQCVKHCPTGALTYSEV